MKIQLDTKKKQLVLEKPVTITQIQTILRTIFPSDYDRDNYDFLINIGSIPDKDITVVTIPVTRNWNYYPNFKWLNYTKDQSIVLDDEIHNNSEKNVIFNDGIYNIEINIK